jgi:hypothetical protein
MIWLRHELWEYNDGLGYRLATRTETDETGAAHREGTLRHVFYAPSPAAAKAQYWALRQLGPIIPSRFESDTPFTLAQLQAQLAQFPDDATLHGQPILHPDEETTEPAAALTVPVAENVAGVEPEDGAPQSLEPWPVVAHSEPVPAEQNPVERETAAEPSVTEAEPVAAAAEAVVDEAQRPTSCRSGSPWPTPPCSRRKRRTPSRTAARWRSWNASPPSHRAHWRSPWPSWSPTRRHTTPQDDQPTAELTRPLSVVASHSRRDGGDEHTPCHWWPVACDGPTRNRRCRAAVVEPLVPEPVTDGAETVEPLVPEPVAVEKPPPSRIRWDRSPRSGRPRSGEGKTPQVGLLRRPAARLDAVDHTGRGRSGRRPGDRDLRRADAAGLLKAEQARALPDQVRDLSIVKTLLP